MITPFDDYPIHQTADPITQPATGDPNHYDRYFFNGYDADGRFFIGGAMGHYPNRGVIDAAFSIVVDGVQHSVFASGAMPRDRSTVVGPIGIEVVEPLRTIRLSVGPNEHGLDADLTFRARTEAIEEPRQTIVRDGRLIMDYTRLTQWGRWEGRMSVRGADITVDPARTFGTRDRSWGVRGVGVQAPTNFPPAAPQVFWLWAPLHFRNFCTHLALFERADGERWLESALVVPATDGDASAGGDRAAPEALWEVGYDLSWQPGRREVASAALMFRRGAGTSRIDFEPLFTFRMRGIGYSHPEWSHGSVHGPLAVGGEAVGLGDFDPQDPSCIHIQTLCRVTMDGEQGIGVLEQLVFGDHAPSGLRGVVEGFRPA